MKIKLSIFCFLFFFLISSAQAKEVPKKIKKANTSVVLISILDDTNWSQDKKNLRVVGSGVAVKHNIVATSCTEISTKNNIVIVLGGLYSFAEIIAHDNLLNICLLKVYHMILRPVKVRPSDDLVIGESIYLLNHPKMKKIPKGKLENIVKHKDMVFIVSDVLQKQGAKSGSMFDQDGYLIAIVGSPSKNQDKKTSSVSSDWIIKTLKLKPHYKNKKPQDNGH